MRFILFVLILAALAACSSQDESATPRSADQRPAAAAETDSQEHPGSKNVSPRELSREDLRSLASDPEAMQEIMGDPERRQEVRERLKELRQEGKGDDERSDRRAAMRERAERYRQSRQSRSRKEGQLRTQGEGEQRRRGRSARWWENDVIAGDIGLSEQQVADIASAHQQVMSAARESRQELAEVASSMQGALKSGDPEALGELVDARLEAVQARARAEADWMERLLDTLSAEQMRKLAEEKPELVSVLLAPVR